MEKTKLPNIVGIIQVRQGSTRLPGKAMKKVLGKPLLGYLLERVARSEWLNAVVAATTALPEDDVIEHFCQTSGVACFRGSSEDVLGRYLAAAQLMSADVIVRITGDCPLIDPEVIDLVIKEYMDIYPEIDYASNTLERTFPRGMDVEVISYEALNSAARHTTKISDREHVTPYIYTHPELFTLHSIKDSDNHADLRWTVDTLDDFQLVSNLINALYPENSNFTYEDLLRAMQLHPEWAAINSHVEQRRYEGDVEQK